MKATLLLENHSLFNKYYNAEHGFSAWVEDEDVKVLFDTGYSDKFIKNAEEMKIDLRTADYVVISHNHNDHSGGLKYLVQYYRDHAMCRKPVLLMAHPEIMLRRYQFEEDYCEGMDVSLEVMEKYFDVRFVQEPLWLTKNLVYMGITKISNDFERSFAQGAKKLANGKWEDDYVIEDTQLAYRHKNGREASVIAACAHYGICNIMEYAKKLTGAAHIHTYLGGSHLRSEEVPEPQMDKTCEYVKKEQINRFYICHDTDLPCVIRLANACPAMEAGVGLVVDFE
jgi:7,8-dihydropterin-6-yl-methyl-4-(beta-D-ribofuranosyl)aminobenzene 5'-phosphate synthase